MSNLIEAYSALVVAEADKKGASAELDGISQSFYTVICEASRTDANGEKIMGFDIPRSTILEEIAAKLDLKVKVEIQTTEGRAIIKDGKPVKHCTGSVDTSRTFLRIRSAVRKLEAVNPDMISDDWTETRAAYNAQLAKEKTPAQIIKALLKTLVKKFDIATLRLIASTITAYCDKAELSDDAEKAEAEAA
jgi:hypothetical protein